MEQALAKSEERYQSLFNSIDAAFCIIDVIFDADRQPVDYRFVEVNPAFAVNTGLESALGRSIRELVPAIEESWIAIYAKVALSGEAVRFESHAAALQDRWYEVYAFRVGDPALHRVAVLFNDVSARKHAEAMRTASDARYGALFDFAPDGIVLLNPEGYCIDANPSLCRLLDFTHGELVGLHASQFITETDVRRWQLQRRDGSVLDVDTVATLMPDGSRLGMIRDITERSLSECLLQQANDALLRAEVERAVAAEALFDERERAQVTLNSIGDAVISTDLAGRVTYLNAVAERLTGWAAAEAMGRPLKDVFQVVDADSRAPVPNPMALAARENTSVTLAPICILIRRDAVETAIEDSAAPIHDRLGRVTGAVMVFRDVSASRALSQRLSHLAQHDSLTDLPNRGLFNDRLRQAVILANRHRSALAVLYLDVDRFKHINDSLGHSVGDRLLQSVAQRLSGCVRASDTVSRLGGDEFVILLSEVAQAQDAVGCADKVLQAVRIPYVVEGHELHITASVGIVIYPEDGVEAEVLLQNADSAMYEAKNRGRDTYQFYRSDLNASASRRQSLEGDLRGALARQEFELYYQPLVSLATGGRSGVEALIRWNHPTLGFLLPEHFIPIAEESGLIVPIGQWVLGAACEQANLWRAAGLPPLRLAVNISTVELRSRDFVANVAATLARTGFDSERLELELTETFLMQDSTATAVVLRALKDLGVHLALDDFGTGYSSLSYMRRFPIDALKVDRSFVRHLTTDADDASVVSAVINMGKSLHMRVVAEGVESRAQLEFLQVHECTEAQGYYFGAPCNAGAFAGLLGRDDGA
jgi:diguanylate cyclase (GGDEF)-like protein/PAS domain S-box-containing protein